MKVVKLYLKYFFTLTNVLIFILLTIFLSFCFFMSIYDLNESLSYSEILKSYFENSLYYAKAIILFTVIFIFVKANSERNLYVVNFVVTSGYKKKDNYHFQMLAYIIISILFISIIFIFFIVIGFSMKPYFKIEEVHFIAYFNMIILSLYYGFLVYFLINLFNSQFIFLIPVILNLVSELLIYNNDFLSRTYLFFFPTLITDTGLLSYNCLFCLFLSFVLYNINGYNYLKKDLVN